MTSRVVNEQELIVLLKFPDVETVECCCAGGKHKKRCGCLYFVIYCNNIDRPTACDTIIAMCVIYSYCPTLSCDLCTEKHETFNQHFLYVQESERLYMHSVNHIINPDYIAHWNQLWKAIISQDCGIKPKVPSLAFFVGTSYLTLRMQLSINIPIFFCSWESILGTNFLHISVSIIAPPGASGLTGLNLNITHTHMGCYTVQKTVHDYICLWDFVH